MALFCTRTLCLYTFFSLSISKLKVVWAVRSSYVGNTFFDASASTFFLQNGKETARSGSTTKSESGTPRKHFANGQNFEANISGSSVGPDWVKTFQEVATHKDSTRSRQPLLDVQFGCELGDVCNGNTREDSGIGVRWPVSATLTNGVIVDCDFIVSATGVQPNTGVVGSEFEVKTFLSWSPRLLHFSNVWGIEYRFSLYHPCRAAGVELGPLRLYIVLIRALSRNTAGVHS